MNIMVITPDKTKRIFSPDLKSNWNGRRPNLRQKESKKALKVLKVKKYAEVQGITVMDK